MKQIQKIFLFQYPDKSFNLDYGIQDDRKLPLSLSLSEETVGSSKFFKKNEKATCFFIFSLFNFFLPILLQVVSENEDRATWGNGLEFLMSCIAMSIGLGNVWRFPFTAYENGGGVFLIPYIIVLFLVGKPFYYLEMIIGQFCSRSSVKIWSAGMMQIKRDIYILYNLTNPRSINFTSNFINT